MWILFAVGVVVVVGLAIAFIVWKRKGDDRIESVVMLRRAKRGLSMTDLRGAARRAFGSDLEVVSMPSPDGATNCFAIVIEGVPTLYVIDSGRMYGNDPERESHGFEHAAAREAYKSHRAWLSVDVPSQLWKMVGKERAAQVRPLMARLASELHDDGCILLYSPAMERVALPTPEVEAQLKAGDLTALFGDDDVNQPVFQVEGDAKIEKAIERARREWPTFLEIWGRRGASCQALVKGVFEHGDGHEHMWIEVTKVSGGTVTGELINDPVHVNLKKGQSVTVTAPAGISDWACLDGQKPHGMFVERVLRGG